ncbi:hypothetical protein VOLCADRAFT_107206 [Volvox carteri f. nagariensis]|uniref:Uncharacterized protein n=1 Tax=Volvox carteri f. nagariensis TaxID=3068 RepID=D8UCL1_VOLCA|nr:uncharacterized protein VOLCADRAFT_107206 [Volvox carteri f. nagariensis]EFJ42510.1 hypothetical protein VOLCADRAFT_107206 [Volvox carteri f. nagariensis]|eukprot:XP_002956366.1 hypothetical protein VOLCADRAFT_107206 [Volvox carteri f. nagariensis]
MEDNRATSAETIVADGKINRKPNGGLLVVCWKSYIEELKTRPLRTKCITSACVAGLSDVVAQLIISGHYKSVKRTLAVACFGALYTGPSAHYWQKFMEQLFSGRKDFKTVLQKVLVDQLTYGPVCNVLFMSFATLVLEGKPFSFVRQKIAKDYPGVQLNGWRLWPLAALINYRFVPLQFRVLFINVVAFIWTTFLLLKAKRAQALQVIAKPAAA